MLRLRLIFIIIATFNSVIRFLTLFNGKWAYLRTHPTIRLLQYDVFIWGPAAQCTRYRCNHIQEHLRWHLRCDITLLLLPKCVVCHQHLLSGPGFGPGGSRWRRGSASRRSTAGLDSEQDSGVEESFDFLY